LSLRGKSGGKERKATLSSRNKRGGTLIGGWTGETGRGGGGGCVLTKKRGTTSFLKCIGKTNGGRKK